MAGLHPKTNNNALLHNWNVVGNLQSTVKRQFQEVYGVRAFCQSSDCANTEYIPLGLLLVVVHR